MMTIIKLSNHCSGCNCCMQTTALYKGTDWFVVFEIKALMAANILKQKFTIVANTQPKTAIESIK
jgi:hypothetical protein